MGYESLEDAILDNPRPELRIVTIKGGSDEKAQRKVWNAFVKESGHGEFSTNVYLISKEAGISEVETASLLEKMRKQKQLQYFSTGYLKDSGKTYADLEGGDQNVSGSVQIWNEVYTTPAHGEHHLMSHPSGETAFPDWKDHPLNKRKPAAQLSAADWRKKMYGNPCGGNIMYQNPVEGYLFDYGSPQDRELTGSYIAKRVAMYGGEPSFIEIDYIRRGVPEHIVLNAIIGGELDPDHIAAGSFGLLPPPEVVATAGAAAAGGRDWSAYHVFKNAAERLGVATRIRNKSFSWNGETFTVKELYPRAKEQVGAKLKHDRSGIVWTFPLRTVKSQLTRAGVDWRP